MRYFITLAFKGTNYFGWQIQPDAISVQEVLNKALSTVLRSDITVVGAGRTDAGVHATKMVAHFDLEVDLRDDVKLSHKLNSYLPDDIVVSSIERVKEDAHARFDAERRAYDFCVILGRNPFKLETTWQLYNTDLDVAQMNLACKELLKHKDFKCFSRSKTDVKTFDCLIFDAYWTASENELIFHIEANRFLRNMVRAIVGTMIDVGTGKKSLEEFKEIILSRDRSKAGKSAPSTGLFLSEIIYPPSIVYEDR
ncbi:tRNA pseudouridine(38-40) synthase TruA [Flavobacteriaceae bacterium]|nr:tRNA pseudouridine(38-40) synthase TruA [Flavobacteriaceae bacterium]